MVNYIIDFLKFYLWPNTPLKFILYVAVGIYIFLRVTGKINGPNIGRKQGQSGPSKPDYIIK